MLLSCLTKPQKSSSKRKFTTIRREFDIIYKDQRVFQEYKYFLQTEYAENSLEFIEEVQAFKNLKQDSEKLLKATQIYNLYYEDSSIKQISLKHQTKEDIKILLSSREALKSSVFDVAVQETHQILTESWVRFQCLDPEQLQQIVREGKFNHYRLDDIFHKEYLYIVFKSFLKEEFAEEILLFYEHVQIFKKEKNVDERYKIAKEIFAKYIEKSSERELNLNSELKDSMYTIFEKTISEENTPVDIFDQVFTDVKLSMLLGIWSRFKGTESYDKLFQFDK